MNLRRVVGVGLVAAVLMAGAAGCDVRVAGTRCRVAGATAQDKTHVLVCEKGRWKRSITKAQAALIIIAVVRSKTPADDIATGNGHTCMGMQDRKVKCWGFNSSGQLGDGTTTNSSTPVVATGASTAFTVQLSGGSPVQQTEQGELVAGAEFTCAKSGSQFAATPSSTVRCWGYNGFGQLGLGTTTNVLSPTAVTTDGWGGTLAAGTVHLCTELLIGAVAACAGQNASGQLGNASTTASSTFVSTGITGAVSLAAGSSHSCAVKSDNSVECWGGNGSGQLGDGTTTQRLTPVVVTGLTATKVVAGGDHTCALLADATVKCWGANGDGELGDGTTTSSSTPVAVSGLSGVVSLSAGFDHTCAVTNAGRAYCWGSNTEGQLGTGSNLPADSPTLVSNIVSVTSISAGFGHTCAVAERKGWCWGRNDFGQLGDGTTTASSVPVQVKF